MSAHPPLALDASRLIRARSTLLLGRRYARRGEARRIRKRKMDDVRWVVWVRYIRHPDQCKADSRMRPFGRVFTINL